MILVTRLNGTQYYINAELIQTIESTPDTVIAFTSGIKIIVHESAEEIVERVIEYRRKIFRDLLVNSSGSKERGE